jgi:hypothetical protein
VTFNDLKQYLKMRSEHKTGQAFDTSGGSISLSVSGTYTLTPDKFQFLYTGTAVNATGGINDFFLTGSGTPEFKRQWYLYDNLLNTGNFSTAAGPY